MPCPTSRLRAHVDMIAGTIGERNIWRFTSLQRAADYISEVFTLNGYDPARTCFEVSQVPVCNIEATLQGTSHPAEIVVLGAHYDSVPECPGANDNGTGVAALLELSRRFARRHMRAR